MIEIENDLVSMQSFDAIGNILNGVTLHPLQCIDVMKMLYMKRAIVSYDTGTGKTLLAAAVMQLLWREDSSRRFIIFGMKDQLQQTPKKLESYTGRSVLASASDAKSIKNLLGGDKFLNYPILLLTHECLRNHTLMKALWEHQKDFYGVFVDEAHLLNNKGFAESANVLNGLCKKFEYCIALTATPFTTELTQLAKLASIIDYERYPNHVQLQRNLEHGYFKIGDDPLFFINRTGKELGRNSSYVGRILWVNATADQMKDVAGNELMALCKGNGATEQARKTAELCKSYEDKRGLIYVNQHAVREWLLPFLEKENIKYRCINGFTSATDRAEIMKLFNDEKSIDVVVTSVTTAIDLDCDYVIFYEFTPLLKQMIGRADRGLDGKVLDIWYVLTRNSNEPLYFMTNIVMRSFLTQEILGKEIQEIVSVIDSLQGEIDFDSD